MIVMRIPPLAVPLALGAAPAIAFVGANVRELAVLDDLLRREADVAMLTILAATALVVVAGWSGARRLGLGPEQAALLLSFGVVAFYSFGHVHLALSGTESFGTLRMRHLYGVWVLLGGVALAWVLRRPRRVPEVVRFLGAFGFALLAVVTASLLVGVAAVAEFDRGAAADPVLPGATAAGGGRDIYYIILDGYASDEVLAERFGHDNRGFTNGLRSRGFVVVDEAYSNYATTTLSLPSSFNMRHIETIAAEPGTPDAPSQFPSTSSAANGAVARALRAHGYRYATFDSGAPYTTTPSEADVYAACGEPQSFVREFLRTTALKPWMDAGGKAAKVERIRCGFAFLREAPRLEPPVFVVAHFLVPHPPYVFGADGRVSDVEDGGPNAWHPPEGYVEQLRYTNGMVLQAVDTILADSEPAPIIVIQGDHGPATHPFPRGTEPPLEAIRDRLGILNAYHLPDGGDALLYDTITPVNTFRVVLNHYFGTDLPLVPDTLYYTDPRDEAGWTDVTERVRGGGPQGASAP
ncbi:MAG: hypothetical protein ACT4PT_06470 [Methanobacteriota archaeon]